MMVKENIKTELAEKYKSKNISSKEGKINKEKFVSQTIIKL